MRPATTLPPSSSRSTAARRRPCLPWPPRCSPPAADRACSRSRPRTTACARRSGATPAASSPRPRPPRRRGSASSGAPTVDRGSRGVVVPATHTEVGEAVAAADAARASWRRTPPAERAAALRRAAASVRAAAPEFGAMLTATTGRLIGQAVEGAEVAADLLDEAATTGLGPTGRTLAGAGTALDVVRREPRGVVAVITPWNDPFPAAAGKKREFQKLLHQQDCSPL
ncbi:aldehyde dehydrogenase family protein [Georgenia sp. SUBG003]|uniref:aldehyde dehydrogenase family protein n=1 Tax=Georgenia sp. SUBG003 TaxID=1497974 RepID=UPI003AB4CFB9